jgi:hypothetical protein
MFGFGVKYKISTKYLEFFCKGVFLVVVVGFNNVFASNFAPNSKLIQQNHDTIYQNKYNINLNHIRQCKCIDDPQIKSMMYIAHSKPNAIIKITYNQVFEATIVNSIRDKLEQDHIKLDIQEPNSFAGFNRLPISSRSFRNTNNHDVIILQLIEPSNI